jgi:hypothetical protein
MVKEPATCRTLHQGATVGAVTLVVPAKIGLVACVCLIDYLMSSAASAGTAVRVLSGGIIIWASAAGQSLLGRDFSRPIRGQVGEEIDVQFPAASAGGTIETTIGYFYVEPD